jgi:predicted amidophosphoribosyltransferase
MPGAYLLLIVVVLLLALPVVLLMREVRALCAAGISDTQPVCAKCRYRMRGWGSPICPECGSDVREVGSSQGPTGRGVSRGRSR